MRDRPTGNSPGRFWGTTTVLTAGLARLLLVRNSLLEESPESETRRPAGRLVVSNMGFFLHSGPAMWALLCCFWHLKRRCFLLCYLLECKTAQVPSSLCLVNKENAAANRLPIKPQNRCFFASFQQPRWSSKSTPFLLFFVLLRPVFSAVTC